jgi:hypothetical protein
LENNIPKELLLVALTHFRSVPVRNINLMIWWDLQPDCGSVGCFCGHSVLVVPELQYDNDNGTVYCTRPSNLTNPLPERLWGMEAAAEVFGIRKETAWKLFSNQAYPARFHPPDINQDQFDPGALKAEVIRRIEMVLEEGEEEFLSWFESASDLQKERERVARCL